MRSIYTINLLFFCLITTQAQTPNWAWVQSAGTLQSGGQSICTDGYGNVYVTGSFSRPYAIFGADSLTSVSNNTVFLVKYDGSGNVIWAKSSVGTKNDIAYGICCDAQGNVYITGTFQSPSIIFGADTLLNTNTVYNAGYTNVFVVKYDPLGNVIWAKNSKGEGGFNASHSIIVDTHGNAYITGSFWNDSITFDSTTLTVITGPITAFLTKYDSVGNLIWAKGINAEGAVWSQSIKLDAQDNPWVTGYFFDSLLFLGGDTIKSPTYNVHSNFFIAKYTPSGNVVWAKGSMGNGYAYGESMTIDPSGNAYAIGYFDSTTIAFGTDILTNADSVENIFIVKYDSLGNVIWARTTVDIGSVWGYDIKTDASGFFYVVGDFNNSVVFGTDTLNSLGEIMVFTTKYDTSGNVVWAKCASGLGDALGASVSVYENNSIYVTGSYTGDIFFGRDTITDTLYFSVFVAKLSDYPTGIKPVSNSSPITIYPNPSTGTFYFSGLQNESTVEVYNVLGEMVFSTAISTDNNQINLSAQAKGIYFYKIHSTTQDIQQGKIVIE